MFKLCTGHNRGFHMTFENGWTVSVQWAPGNYCHNYGIDKPEDESPTAETACWLNDGAVSEVTGHRTADDVAAYIMEVSLRKPAEV